jgi:TolB-like protein
MADIFLSYTREDQATAQRFAEAFEAQGFSVWWDVTLRSGEAYDQVTEEALRTAKAVVVLWSKKSAVSRWVRAEATLADRNRTLVPATIEPCERPIMFELTQTADLSRWSGRSSDPAWLAFLADVRRFVEMRGAPQPPPVRPSPQTAQPPASRPSLAVLPFVNRSGLQTDDVFADGMAEDLTAALALSYWLKVVASRATAVYRNAALDLRQIGRDLGVRYLLEGNVRRVGEHMRVTAQLLEAESGAVLWTQKFDRPLAALAALQEDLVSEVAAHLGTPVHRAEIAHALRKPGTISAWEAAMRADAYVVRGTRAGTQAAVAEARRGVEDNPDDAFAYASLAAYQGQLLHYCGSDDPRLALEIVQNVARARALDPTNPDVLDGVATALAWMRKPLEALPLAERAVATKPNADVSHYILGIVLVGLGRSDDAIAALDTFERLAPHNVFGDLELVFRSVAHLQAGRLDEALAAADRALARLPGPDALIQSALCLARQGDWDRAREAMRRLREADLEISLPLIEGMVGDFYYGSSAAEDYVASARKVWNQASTELQSP